MADSKLADLTAITTPADTDVVYVVHDPAGTPVDRKITVANLRGVLSSMEAPGFINGTPNTVSNISGSANVLVGCFIFIPVPILVTTCHIRVQTQAGSISVAVWNKAGTSQLLTTGSVACPAAGLAAIAFTGSATLTPGTYRIGLSASSTGAQFSVMADARGLGSFNGASSHPAPADVSGLAATGTTNVVPTIGLF